MPRLSRLAIFCATALTLMLGLLLWSRRPAAAQDAPAAPTFTVNTTADAHAGGVLTNGVCQTAPGNGLCTLRAAIEKANNWPGGGATINFDGVTPPATYTLSIGQLLITNSMTIVGAGPLNTIVDGNGGVTNDRVFEITGPAPVSLSGVTVQGGRTTQGGAAIFVFGGRVTIDNSLIRDNGCACTATTNGVLLNTGALTLNDSIVSDNDAGSGALGGGIYNASMAWFNHDTIRSNNAQSGGGIYNDGDLTILNSAIISNSVTGNGGGISTTAGRSLTVVNSTISGNRANGSGGGIFGEPSGLFCRRGTAGVYNATITNNLADADLSSGADSGGVSNETACIVFNFNNSIIAYNFGAVLVNGFRFNQPNQDCAGSLTAQAFNLVGGTPSDCIITGTYTLADPKLGPLQNNGGPTPTHALLPGSPAIDAGEMPNCTDNSGQPVLTDQRGFPRPAFGGAALRCDIGAYELFRFGVFLPLAVR